MLGHPGEYKTSSVFVADGVEDDMAHRLITPIKLLQSTPFEVELGLAGATDQHFGGRTELNHAVIHRCKIFEDEH
ncbi:hypothetical protein D3C86_2165520 [compost metagenome]